MPVETEIKLRIPAGADSARELLALHGYKPTASRELEVDQVFDLPDLSLRNSGQLLRLRHRGGQWTLTYKGPYQPGRLKSREEIETALSDGEAFELILGSLGYVPTFRYEKYRTKFMTHKSRLITLDETPIGCFLELEGPEYWIDETAQDLGFSADQYITKSYAALYNEYLADHPESPSNMIF